MGDPLGRFHVLDPAQREDTLSHLVAALNGTERRVLSQYISARSDPLNRLPIELVQEIFHYLPVLNTWRLQLVCRHWRCILGSPEVQANRLARDGRLPVATATLSRTFDEGIIRHAVRQMQAQRLGRPHSYCDVRFPGAQSRDDTIYPEYRNPHVFALRGHTIAYVRKPARGESEIVVHDLVTGQDLVFCGEAREDITCLTLTDDLLGFASTEGVLYVVDLRSHEPPVRLRLPSAQATALAGDEDTVVALLDCSMIAVYASSTKRLETYYFQPQVEGQYNVALEPAMIMLSIRRGTIDVFSNGNRIEVLAGEDGTDEEALPQLIHHIGHMRFALDGSHLPTHKRLEVKVSSGVELRTEWKVAIGGIHPLGVVDQHHVRLQGLYLNDADIYWQQDRTIVFDAKTALLHLEHHRLVERPCRSQFTGELLLRWKDCYYMLDYPWNVVDTFVEVPDGIDSQENIIGLAGQSSPFPVQRRR